MNRKRNPARFDSTMLRIGSMNMLLHGVENPDIRYRDSLAQNHLNNIVIHRLRTNQRLTASDLRELETMLVKIGEEDGKKLLSNQSLTPPQIRFVEMIIEQLTARRDRAGSII